MGYRPRNIVAAMIVALLVMAAATAYAANRHYDNKPKPVVAPVDPRPTYCDDPEGVGVERAGTVAAIFVISTVLSDGKRPAPECSYDLVTRALKGDDTRAEWKRGPIKVVPMVLDFIDPGYVNSYAIDGSVEATDFRDPAGRECVEDGVAECYPTKVSAHLVIEGSFEHRPVSQEFLIRLVRESGEFKVDYWQPVLQPLGTGPSMKE